MHTFISTLRETRQKEVAFFMNRLSRFLLCLLFLCGTRYMAVGFSENEVTFGDQSWPSIRFHHRVMAYLLEYGYDMEPRLTVMDPVPSLIALRRGENHIIMEIWTETRQDWWNTTRESGKVRELGKIFPLASTGIYVPTYLIKGDPERGIAPLAPDLISLFDLPRYKHLFPDPEDPSKGIIYNAVPGWRAHDRYKIKTLGYTINGKALADFFNLKAPPSQEVLAQTIREAYRKGRGVAAYYWEPSALLGKLDMTLLQEPSYDEKIFLETGLCRQPSFSVEKAAHAKWVERHPEAVPLLKNYYLELETMNDILLWMESHGNDPSKAALWFLRNYPSLWQSWMEDPARTEKVKKALKRHETTSWEPPQEEGLSL